MACAPSIISNLATSEISLFSLVSVAEQAGLVLTWEETPKTGFSRRGPFDIQTLQDLCIGIAPFTQYTHMHNKNSNTQGSSPNVVSDFPYLKELLLKERICSPWEQIRSFKRISNFEKGHNCRESLLDTVVSL